MLADQGTCKKREPKNVAFHAIHSMLTSCLFAMIFAAVLCSPLPAQEGAEVAVLYFTDHSGFDSGGCLSFWPLSAIFGTGQERETWDLELGFRNLLNQRLSEAGYGITDPGYLDEVLRVKGKDDLEALADELNADIMIVGDITKFEQHRTRASSQGPTEIVGEGDMRLAAMGGIGGFFYSSSVRANITIYDDSGDELESDEISSKKNLRDFYMGVGPMTYHRGDTKNENDEPGSERPIVDHEKLDALEFGTDEFKDRTLFGMATMDVMDKTTAKVGEYLEPAGSDSIQGKIIYVGTGERLTEDQVYINLGAGDGLRQGRRLGVYIEGRQLTDPDTGEELGILDEEKIGVIKVSKVEADHLSIAEIIERTRQIERGSIVKRETRPELRPQGGQVE